MTKAKKTIIIGISSSIAAYKILDLVRLLRKKSIEVFVIMTRNAALMIPPKEFEIVSGHKVEIDLFSAKFHYKDILLKKQVKHIELAAKADLIVIAPATANIIGKIAAGFADDFLTTTLLVARCPIIICPSMNSNMWTNKIVKENMKKLKDLGHFILPPEEGPLACGVVGVGRLPDIKKITAKIFSLIETKEKLKGKKILVTAGGTIESIDPVRVITNKSSGKMGVAIAEVCFTQGAEVLLLRARSSVIPNYPIKEELFETAGELETLIKKNIKNYDVIFQVAAVSDFVPEKSISRKIESNKSLILHLKPALKILHELKTWNPKIKVVGFKAIYKEKEKNLINIGMEKLRMSHADFIIINDVGKNGIGFGADDNEVYIVSPKGLEGKISKSPKKEIAEKIIEHLKQYFL